ncbi:MAG: hypothetical protein CMQ40_03135 [Gammaproteobacteria bacterium]|nr:hypothetical protein [Gammaproteobacteria bacterium]
MPDFSEIVSERLTRPILQLCELFAEEGALDQYTFFSGISNMLRDPSDEPMILAATIELSRCAFLGFVYSREAQTRIDKILEDAIDIAYTMSASDVN